MKIIFQGYNTCCQNVSGGVQNRLMKIASLLQERGVEIELFNPFETKLQAGDILHIFMLSLDNYSLIEYAKFKGVKVVVSTIVPLIDRSKLRLYKAFYPLPLVTSYKFNRTSLFSADVLITESKRESDFIAKYYSVPKDKFYVIPNGVDVDVDKYEGEEIFDKLGKKCKYVLQVGRFDHNKNQLKVIKAMKGRGINVVFIGGPGNGRESYYHSCREEAKGCDNFHFIGWIENKDCLLESAYVHAEVVILPSYYETFGLVAIEGGSRGAKLALSKSLPINDYEVFRKCPKFDPSDISDIRAKIESIYRAPNDGTLAKCIINTFNWGKIIDQHIELYNSLI